MLAWLGTSFTFLMTALGAATVFFFARAVCERAQGALLSLPVLSRRRTEELAALMRRGGFWRFQWALDVEVCYSACHRADGGGGAAAAVSACGGGHRAGCAAAGAA